MRVTERQHCRSTGKAIVQQLDPNANIAKSNKLVEDGAIAPAVANVPASSVVKQVTATANGKAASARKAQMERERMSEHVAPFLLLSFYAHILL